MFQEVLIVWLCEVFGKILYEAASDSDCVVSNSVKNDELKVNFLIGSQVDFSCIR
jgi:hypothetical protein